LGDKCRVGIPAHQQSLVIEIYTITEKVGNKKPRYTHEEVKAITEVQVKFAKDLIPFEVASRNILNISDRFPVHNLMQYDKQMKDRLEGTTKYGLAIPAN